MAYLRNTETCSIYFYAHSAGGYECCGCLLAPGPIEPPFPHFSGPEDAARHLQEHRDAGHAPVDTVNLAIDQLFGYMPRTPDPVIEELVRRARAAGDNSKVASYDTDVPADLRVTLEQVVEHYESGEDDPDFEAPEMIVPEEVLREVPGILRGGREASPN